MRRDWPFAPCEAVASVATLAELLAHRATTTPDRVAYTWLDGDTLTEETSLTDSTLHDDARRAAALLAETLAVGERAILLFDSGLDFLRAFLGCQVAGVVPVPVMPPRDASSAEIGRVMRILSDAATTTVLTTAPIAALARALPGAAALDWRVLDLDGVAPIDPREPAELALLQYTSGSTSAPRGVMVGHDNLLRNLAYIFWGENNTPDSVSVSWLPMTHDMGLVEGVLQPLYSGHRAYLFHPRHFLKRPVGWLEVISRTGATLSGGPDFAYSLLLRRLAGRPLPRVDLSRWRFAYDGSEPVRADTVDAFCARMAPLGFRREAFQPLYGMAEATLGVTAGRFGAPPRFARRDGPGGSRRVVSCGETPDDLRCVVVDPDTGSPRPEGEEGEILLSGPCIARGYWRRPEATEATFGARVPGSNERFLRTGDLGFVRDGELFVTGRRKELVICRGVNVHPQDLEVTAEAAHPALRPGGSVAFGVELDDGEAVVLVAEVARRALADLDGEAVVRDVRRSLARFHGVVLADVVLVEQGTVPRTTSGKRQRMRVAKDWRAGRLGKRVDVGGGSERVVAESGDGSELATCMLELVADRLGVEDPRALDDSLTLPELGLSSLDVIELHAAIEDASALDVSLGRLLAEPLVQLLATLPDRRPRADDRTPAAPLAATPPPAAPSPAAAPRATDAILLTGATGFVGAAIAVELLASTPHALICLVRGDPGRLLDHLAAVPGWDPAWAQRVEVVTADLASPALGLDEASLDALSTKSGAIVHAGAMVNWVYPESALAPTNVGGTRTLLALAARRSTRFVYLSSLACCWSLTADGPVDGDTDPADHLDGIHLPYVRTKALGESLVRRAGAMGLPIRILRPGLVLGDPDRHHHSPGDFLTSLFRGCIEIGAAPELDWDLEVCPVGEVATAAVAAALGADGPETLHLESPERRPWRSVALWMALRGYRMSLEPFSAWSGRLTSADSALRPLEPFFRRPVVGGLTVPELYERTRRNPIHAPNAPGGPPLDARFLERTFSDLTALGYLPAPAEPPPEPPGLPTAADLSGWLGCRVEAVREVPWPRGHGTDSLIGELASWRHGRAAGVRRLEVSIGGEVRSLVMKSQVEPAVALDIGQRIADLCGAALGEAWHAHRPYSEVVRSAERERALYSCDLPAPALVGHGPGVLLLDDLSDRRTPWTPAAVPAAIRGIAAVHATAPFDAPWLPPRRTAATLNATMPLWRALADRVLGGTFGRWLGPEGRSRYEELLTDDGWVHTRDALPQTLVHNDFSPRNATILADGRLCAWDWELAAIGLPQRDTAELLCFVGSPPLLDDTLALHRELLGFDDAAAFRTGFEVALAELLVTRLALYALIDDFRRQPFLERVTRTWVDLDAAVRR
jgi:thioester reductase-like protein